ncbi:DUF397 domain-containing protein [Actinokineospora pegani]|uniref:DUF397 domain-containing protein n=1 Tax=Actinokineospora pegani TaxID=2654637 RepID=UPI0012EAD42E|nr:DUF397 domain-containing protein [Actinokineospora pegani]
MSARPKTGWVRASGCGAQFDCVELRVPDGGRVWFRDSKSPTPRTLALPVSALAELVGFVGARGAD